MSGVDLFMRAHLRLSELLRLRAVPRGEGRSTVTQHQLRILRELDEVDPVMVGELAEYLGVTASTMSLNLKRLETAGLVVRERDPADRRAMNVRLTAEGRTLRDEAPELDPARVDALLASLRPEDRDRALDALRLLIEAADRLDADHARYVRALAGEGPAVGARA